MDLVGTELVDLVGMELVVVELEMVEQQAAVEPGQCCDATHVAAEAMDPGIVHKGTRIPAVVIRAMRKVRL